MAINNGTCESSRTSALAEIKTCLKAPEIIAPQPSVPIEGHITVSLIPQITTFNSPLDVNSIQVTKQPVSGAKASVNQGDLDLDYSGISFSGTDQLTIRACDLNGSCASSDISVEVVGDITVFNAVSPNGDNKNEIFLIQYVELLPETKNNRVTIFNRWGDAVFETENYDNVNRVFRGLNTTGDDLPAGTYFYKIDFTSDLETKTGFISLRR